MRELTAVLDPGVPAGGRTEAPRPGALRFADGRFRVELGASEASLRVEPDLVVAVCGRIDALPSGAPSATGVEDDPAAVVLDVWRRAGATGLRGAAGDFVAVCYDRRGSTISVFRDLAGAVPAYLVSGSRAGVSTSLAAARTLAGRTSTDWRWTRAYLDGTWPDPELSPYAEIELLPPGRLAVSGQGSWRTDRLDDWQWTEDVPSGLEESAERLRELFDRAVRRRLAGGGLPTAVTTSGGLDSSSVLVTARHVAPDAPVVALALAFTDPAGDERVHQESVARSAGVPIVWVAPDDLPGPFGAGPDALLDQHQGPPGTGNWFLHDALRRAAVDLGVARVLDGEDGDGVVGGNSLYLADLLGRGRVVDWSVETLLLCRARRANPIRMARRSVGQVRVAARTGRLGRSYQTSVRGLVDGGYLTTLTASTFAQWAALPLGVGHPFLDRHLVEYALALPTRHRIHRGRSKVALRRAMDGRLPPGVAGRTDKADLGRPFVSAVTGRQRPFLEEGLALAQAALGDLDGYTVPRSVGDDPRQVYASYRAAVIGYWLDWPNRSGAPPVDVAHPADTCERAGP